MRVTVEQSGGFTGIASSCAVSSDELAPEEVSHLRRLVDEAGFFALPEKMSGAGYPDQFQYQVTVEESGRRHDVTVAESALPERLRPLLNWVTDKAGRK